MDMKNFVVAVLPAAMLTMLVACTSSQKVIEIPGEVPAPKVSTGTSSPQHRGGRCGG
jgi:hypothetical protein